MRTTATIRTAKARKKINVPPIIFKKLSETQRKYVESFAEQISYLISKLLRNPSL
jgi:hypothetical protein